MTKNINIDDVNLQLFDQLMRLNTDDNTDESELKLKEEIQKAKAMTDIAQAIFNGKKIQLDAYKLIANGKAHDSELKDFINTQKLLK